MVATISIAYSINAENISTPVPVTSTLPVVLVTTMKSPSAAISSIIAPDVCQCVQRDYCADGGGAIKPRGVVSCICLRLIILHI